MIIKVDPKPRVPRGKIKAASSSDTTCAGRRGQGKGGGGGGGVGFGGLGRGVRISGFRVSGFGQGVGFVDDQTPKSR